MGVVTGVEGHIISAECSGQIAVLIARGRASVECFDEIRVGDVEFERIDADDWTWMAFQS